MTSFDIDNLDAADEGQMTVMAGGQLTDWVWTFAGPGHPKAIAQNARVSKEQLSKRRLQEQAQVNGKKWKAPDESPDDILKNNVEFVLERLLGWKVVKPDGAIEEVQMGGKDYPFSEDNARKLLMDRKKGALLQQAVEYLMDDNSFTVRSEKN